MEGCPNGKGAYIG